MNLLEVPQSVAAENVTRGPRRPHMEVMNPATGDVWLLQDPVSAEDFAALRIEPPFIKTGMTTGAMDSAWFGRSPGAAIDGPVETRLIGGRRFARIARVRQFGGLPRGEAATLIRVEKHHALGFAAGRTVTAARLPDGQYYVEQTEAMPGRVFTSPADWQLFALDLAAPWSLQVDSPVSVYFFTSLRSFMGPLAEGQLPVVPRPLSGAA